MLRNTLAAPARAFEVPGSAPAKAHGLAIGQTSRPATPQARFPGSSKSAHFLIGVTVCGGIFAA